MNWLGIGYVLFWLIGWPAAMVVLLIKEHCDKKRRHKRCHAPIEYWWERKVG